jgi:hypothetical protein
MSRPASVGIGAAVLAIVCCAGLPLIASVLGGLALATLLGLAGAILAVALIAAALVLRVRRRADPLPKHERHTGGQQ